MSARLEARDLAFRYGDREVLRGVSLHAEEGELVGVVGENGAGKSTLLRLLLGFLEPAAGEVRLLGEALSGLSRREVARRAAFVPQGFHTEFGFTVREMVAMGRTPHLGRFRPEGEADRRAIAEAMRLADVGAMADRPFPALSGGERQRVLLARAFAQEARVLVLDEPNANLDPRHAFGLLSLVHQKTRQGCAAVAALHDLTLAARFCDRLVFLHEGRVAADGPPAEVLDEARLAEVFGVRAELLTDADGHPVVAVRGLEE